MAVVQLAMRIIAASTGLTAIALAALLGASAGLAPGVSPATATAPAAWRDPPARVVATAPAIAVPVAPSAVAMPASIPSTGVPQASAAAVPLRISVKPRAPHRRTIRRATPKAAPARVQVAALATSAVAQAEVRKPRPGATPLAVGPVGDILRGIGAID